MSKTRKEKLVGKIIEGFENGLGGNRTCDCLVTYLLGTEEWENHYCPMLQKVYEHSNYEENPFNCIEKTGYTFEELMQIEYVYEDRIPIKTASGVYLHNARNIMEGEVDKPKEFDVSMAIERVIGFLDELESKKFLNEEKQHEISG